MLNVIHVQVHVGLISHTGDFKILVLGIHIYLCMHGTGTIIIVNVVEQYSLNGAFLLEATINTFISFFNLS